MKKDADLTLLAGGRGSGKTTFLREYMKDRKRVIALDPMDDMGLKGFKRLKRITGKNGIAAHIKANWEKGYKIQVPTGHRAGECQAYMMELVQALFIIQADYKAGKRSAKGKEITLVIDEAHKFIPNPPRDSLHTCLDDFINLGRHYGVDCVAASQSVVKIWTEYRKSAMHHYFFRQGDHNDIDTITSMIGRANKEKLLELKTHEYLHLDKTQGLHVEQGKNKAKFK